jgi:hypothetical protein
MSIHRGKALGLDPYQIEQHVQEIIAQSVSGMNGKQRGTPVDPQDL